MNGKLLITRCVVTAGLVHSLALAAVAGPPPNGGSPALTNRALPFAANASGMPYHRARLTTTVPAPTYRPVFARPAAALPQRRPQFMQSAPGAFSPGSPGANNAGNGSGFTGSTITQVAVAPNGGNAAGNGFGAGQGGGGILYVTIPAPTIYTQIIARQFFNGVLR